MSPAANRPRSIAVSIFALVIGAVAVMATAFVAITFVGPPPRPAPQMMDDIAHMLRTGKPLARTVMIPAPGPMPPPRPGAPRMSLSPPHGLTFGMATTAPTPRRGEQPDRELAEQVAAAIGLPSSRVVAYRDERMVFAPGAVVGGFTIGAVDKARWRVVRTEARPLVSHWQLTMFLAVLGAILLLAGPAWLLSRAISRPLRQLGRTAAAARVGAPLGPIPEGGATEVRDLASAVSAMHARLTRDAEGRTVMLAAIAHDLGTPLSRIAFWIEQLPEAARVRAAADIDEMRAMLGDTLRLTRNEVGERADQRIDLGSLLDSLVEDMSMAGARATLEHGERAIVRGDPGALRRLFGNLVENAVRYGDSAALSWRIDGAVAEIRIDDAGPGFGSPPDRLFEPFMRGDPSRNRETGGTGLGLAIVRSIAEAHGGTVSLGSHEGGGRVLVRLPLAR
ncbi:MAG: ATP-binding protein [Sphingomonas sp.]|jgi:signal transduction histidine kinase|uniref:sensor histidine kinase n=1 Tax=Sphingomonas sp. TaxID=28214 RepID=UPI0035620AEC